jgi:hypothetical protein
MRNANEAINKPNQQSIQEKTGEQKNTIKCTHFVPGKTLKSSGH